MLKGEIGRRLRRLNRKTESGSISKPDFRPPLPDFRFPIPDFRFPISDSRFPIPDFRFPDFRRQTVTRNRILRDERAALF